MTVEELKRSGKYELHHKGIRIGRFPNALVERYKGDCGEGYVIISPHDSSELLINVEYFIRKEKNTMNEQIANLLCELEENYECTSFLAVDTHINIKIIETILKSNLEDWQKEKIIHRYATCKITAIEALKSCYTLH